MWLLRVVVSLIFDFTAIGSGSVWGDGWIWVGVSLAISGVYLMFLLYGTFATCTCTKLARFVASAWAPALQLGVVVTAGAVRLPYCRLQVPQEHFRPRRTRDNAGAVPTHGWCAAAPAGCSVRSARAARLHSTTVRPARLHPTTAAVRAACVHPAAAAAICVLSGAPEGVDSSSG